MLTRMGRYPGTAGIALFVLMAFVNVVVEPAALSAYNISSTLQIAMPLVLGTLAQTLIMIAGGIDLSIGGVMSLTNAVVAVTSPSIGLAGSVALALSAGAFVGLVNGFAIGILRIQPLVATLATYFAASGAALLILPTPGGAVPDLLMSVYREQVAGFPLALVPAALVLLAWFFARPGYGRWLFALGGNERNALRNGVPVMKVRFIAYVCAGLMASLAGLALTAEIASGDPHSGNSYLLSTVAAAVLGGTSLAGGYGSLVGSVGGALSLALIDHIVFFADVPWYFQEAVSSAIVLGGIAVAALTRFRPKMGHA
jgi:ribose transport system permease protein